jgi:Zn-finger nucleic acid-binding protein
MIEVAATTEPEPRIDVCRLCHFVWFDADELARFTPLPPPPKSTDAGAFAGSA